MPRQLSEAEFQLRRAIYRTGDLLANYDVDEKDVEVLGRQLMIDSGVCPNCRGTGEGGDEDGPVEPCPYCGGSGFTRDLLSDSDPERKPAPQRVVVTNHALDRLRERFAEDVSGADQDLVRLLVGMFHNSKEVGERVTDLAFVRVSEFYRSGRKIGLSCKTEGDVVKIITVLYPEELHTTGCIRLDEEGS